MLLLLTVWDGQNTFSSLSLASHHFKNKNDIFNLCISSLSPFKKITLAVKEKAKKKEKSIRDNKNFYVFVISWLADELPSD
jgi:hypothetical protein